MIERHVQTIFCDDIRHEINFKQSYIGVYAGKLLIPDFPITLPKLCLDVKIFSPLEKPIESLTLRVHKNDEIFQEIVIEKDQLIAATQLPDEITEGDEPYDTQILMMQLVFSPIKFEKACYMKVIALTESGEVKGSGLRIARLPENYLNAVNASK